VEAVVKRNAKSLPAETQITTHDDGKFIRTALVIEPKEGKSGSVDIVTKDGKRLCQINLFAYEDGSLIVDVIDVDDRYKIRRALVFSDGERRSIDVGNGNLVSVDFKGVARKIAKRVAGGKL
jgi:hypothetical protein